MESATKPAGPPEGLTRWLARRAAATRFDALPDDVVEWARQCLLDGIGVTVAGSPEPLCDILLRGIVEEGGHPQATLVARRERGTLAQAALFNGSASHALDYDDVNLAMIGHPTVPVIGALLGLAEATRASGTAFVEAFVAGYETECRLGRAMLPDHYARGWHSTATNGTIAAAAACANLLRLDAAQTANAFGIAVAQAAGLKSMFGTMTKPLHVGKAAQNGLQAARWSQQGFTSCDTAIEAPQGYADTYTRTFDPLRATEEPGRWWIRENLFKYHAACYLTHSAIDAARALRAKLGEGVGAIDRVVLACDPGHLKVCNIPAPMTGLEVKFSLRHTIALGLLGHDTAALETYSDELARDPRLVALRDRVEVRPEATGTQTRVRLEVQAANGSPVEVADTGIPSSDLRAQRERLEAKFRSLVAPRLGADRAEELVGLVRRIETLDDVGGLVCRLAA